MDVLLRDMNGRWIAVADIAGERELGLGSDAADATADSLRSLGDDAMAALLADVWMTDR